MLQTEERYDPSAEHDVIGIVQNISVNLHISGRTVWIPLSSVKIFHLLKGIYIFCHLIVLEVLQQLPPFPFLLPKPLNSTLRLSWSNS